MTKAEYEADKKKLIQECHMLESLKTPEIYLEFDRVTVEVLFMFCLLGLEVLYDS